MNAQAESHSPEPEPEGHPALQHMGLSGNGNANGNGDRGSDGNGHGNGEEAIAATQPVESGELPRLAFPIVGIGASAGGLEAYIEFLEAMPADSGMAFVLVQHLSPQRESMIADILSKHTRMNVLQVEDGQAVEPNHVYIIRPGHTMTLADGRLHLGESLLSAGHRRPVDDFFRSLATEQRQRAIAVIFSGMGSNGTAGAQAVKVVGGLCIAQDPDSAKFPSMPRSFLNSGFADFVLRPSEVPGVLLRYANHPYVREIAAPYKVLPRHGVAVNEIISILRARARHDFSGYRKGTILRRIERRMGLRQIEDFTEYARALRQNPAEATALADDLLIHVTGFFRDPDAWQALKEKIIDPLLVERSEDEPIRAWVTACSSGEEAYTLAILLTEAVEATGKNIEIKIFATDMAERSLAQARAGLFAGGIESEISPERLERYFEKEDSMYRIKREIRELVIFAPQNVLQDPPFSRLDIATCRNLLIYLEPELQKRVLTYLHFGLRQGGALLLGNSESVGELDNEDFELIDKKWRIFRRIGPTRHNRLEFPMSRVLARDVPRPEKEVRTQGSIPELANRALLENFTPASVVDARGEIIFYHGDTRRFLDQPRGEPTRDLLKLAHEEIRGAIRGAMQKAVSTGQLARVLDGLIETPSGKRRIEISAVPLPARQGHTSYLISFADLPEPSEPLYVNQNNTEERRLIDELRRVRDELQGALAEMRHSNEEMKAANEEVTSVNEELQSTNEELETSKEELQSLNEELSTVNAQLQAKMEELERMGSDMASLLSSTDIAVVFLDLKLRIRRYTPPIKDLIELIPSDTGRPLQDLAAKFEDRNLLSDCEAVIERLVPVDREILSTSGRYYVRRVLPYRTIDNRIEGVVITFVDISARRQAEEALRRSVERLRKTVEVDVVGVSFFDNDGRLIDCNEAFLHMVGLSRDEVKSRALTWNDLGPPEWLKQSQLAIEQLRANGKTAPFEREYMRRDGSRWYGLCAASRIDASTSVQYVIDISDRRTNESERAELLERERAARAEAEAANQMKDEFLATLSHELRTPLSAILLWSKMLLGKGVTDPAQWQEGLTSIRNSAESQRTLIDDLLDVARINSGKLRLEMRDVALAEMMRNAVDAIEPTAEARGVLVTTEIGTDVGVVRADPDRLRQVIWNLLANAVKFTPAEGHVTAGLHRRSDGIEISVRDTGIGIKPEFLLHVFERFRQGDAPLTRSEGGLGLGLSIVKKLVELHGGTVSAQSQGLGHGSTFTVKLPLPKVRKRFPGRESGSKAKLSLRAKSVLVVEDNLQTAKAVVALLEQSGLVTRHASTAAAAWTLLEESLPDILISDIGLPIEDGYSLMRRWREHEHAGAGYLPAIAITAFVSQSDKQKALAAGFDVHLAKPIQPDELLESIAVLLAK